MSEADSSRSRPQKRRIRRLIVRGVTQLIVTLGLMVVMFLLGWATLARGLPDPQGWHIDEPESEFRARDARDGYTLTDYLEQEDRVFEELRDFVEGPWSGERMPSFCRFRAGSLTDPATLLDRNWNRTFVLEPEQPVGGAVLVHGLSDAPYSLRAVGEQLYDNGFTVVGLRVPGHGTCPAALTGVKWRDWTAAVRVAVGGVVDRIPEGAPVVLMGYSNGGALVTYYTLEAIDDPDLAVPDAVVLYAPMIGITPLGKFAQLYRTMAWIPAFNKLRWSKIEAEIDPYKYGSWPMNASTQAWAATQRVESRLRALHEQGRAGELPPFLAYQSVVDSTVNATALVRRLFMRLQDPDSELVLYDVNRVGMLDELLRNTHQAEIDRLLADESLPFRLTLVTNETSETLDVVARTRDGASLDETPLDVDWPEDVFSMSHGSVPIPATDPVYGTAEATAATGIDLGSLDLRGEHGVLAISEGLLIRLRHNPFYPFQDEHLMDWLDARFPDR